MKVAGSASWSMSETVPEPLHVALYVRDALRLPVPPEDGVPPLADPVPDRRAVLPDAGRLEAAQQWGSWWEALVGAEVRRADPEPAGALEVWAREYVADLERAGAAPDHLALADRPALRTAAVALSTEAHRWASSVTEAVERREAGFPWELVKDEAEAVASEHGVDVGAVRGTVLVLAVSGLWWREVEPGHVLCSQGVRADRSAARAVLRRAFASRLGG
jgi:hypothetical protein